ncbi:T9SS type A sorting domain-containing protein [Fulvivirga ligni]|uniref:T9SS type A sorting domain-containing protein n=1 Tax=Fulvivirga ligni TaxID=2904246 RepID=UPI001F177A29|nr:T9SS type A sorting domain-containing protein [Fulvivirga ligni]UII23894.1 T9SS type A sorting domain-containing protein [Fulvivirga ligni]
MKYFLLLTLSIFLVTDMFGQATGDFRTFSSGNWDNVNVWERFDGAVWVNPAPSAPTSSDGTITIRANHSIAIASGSVSADQIVIAANNASILSVSEGATLILDNGAGSDLNIQTGGFGGSTAGELQVYGTLQISNGATIANANATRLFVYGTYQHNYQDTPGTVYLASWADGSVLEFSGYTTVDAAPDGLNQSFYDFVWNCPSQNSTDGFIDFDGAFGSTTIRNDFILRNTNDIFFVLTQGTAYTLDIGNDFVVEGNSVLAFNGFSSASSTVNVAGDFLFGSTSSQPSWLSIEGDLDLNISGDLNISSGEFDLNAGSGTSDLSLAGNLTIAGTLTSSVSPSTFNFDGLNQTVSITGSFTGATNTIVNSQSLDLGTSVLRGSGDFTVSAGSELRVGSTAASGAIQSNTTAGNIRVSGTRTYNSGATITYNGAASQFIGTGHPTSSGVNLTIDNSNNVTLAGNVTVGELLTLQSGNLIVGAHTLTLDDGITGSGNITVSASSNIVLNGAGSTGTFPFNDTPTLNSFTLNRAGGGVTFTSDVTLQGALTINAGTLNFNDQALILNGTLVIGDGTGFLASNSSSNLTIGGSGAFGTLTFAAGNNELSTLTVQRPTGALALSGNLNIATTFSLTNGSFDNASGNIFMADGATLIKNSAATFSGNNPEVSPGETYNVSYTGSDQTTGAEIPAATETDALGDLTINAGIISLDQNLQINGVVTLQAGTFSISNNTVTVKNNWVRNNGSLSSGSSGLIIFDGTTTISGTNTATFGNIQLTNGSSLTLPSGTLNFSRNVQIDAGSTFNSNGGSVVLNGGNYNQSISAAGADFNNIRVSKSSGGNVILSNQLDLLGALTFTSPTQVTSNGNLTVISSSDGTSGNGRIGTLIVGASSASVTGDVVVQRYMSGEGRIWRYIASPIQDATVADWQDDFPITGDFTGHSTIAQWPAYTDMKETNASLYYYDETVSSADDQEGWIAYPASGGSNTAPIFAGQGYIAFNRVEDTPTVIDVTGPINTGVTPFNVSVTYTNTGNAAADGWNLIGNPFPSSINWNSTDIDKTNIDNTIYLKDASGQVFYWNGESGDITDGLIATGQAFWVKTNGASPSITISENAKVGSTAEFYRESNTITNQLIVSLSDGNMTDKTYLVVRTDAKDDFDSKYDAYKMNNSAYGKELFDLSSFNSDSVDLAMNYFPEFGCTRTVGLNIKDVKNGNYTLDVDGLNTFEGEVTILLHDTYLDATVDVSIQDSYVFSVDKSIKESYGKGRFYLEYVQEYLSSQLNINYSSDICVAQAANVKLENPQSAASYYLISNGVVISDTLSSINESPINFVISADQLSENSNDYTIKAQAATCSATSEGESFSFNVIDLKPTITVEEDYLKSNYSVGNQWYFNDQPIEGASGAIIQLDQAGVYELRVSQNGCEASSAGFEYLVTGIDFGDNGQFVGYPNPSSETIQFKFNDAIIGKEAVVEIYSPTGQRLNGDKIIVNESYKLNVASWLNGVYLIKFNVEDKVYTQRILKK